MPIPPFEPLPPDHPRIHELVERLKTYPPVSTLRYFQPLPHGACYWNVQLMIQQLGGSMATGWNLTWQPGFRIEANHHAVWRTGEGMLVDVTAHSIQGLFTFIEELEPRNLDLNYPVSIRNEFIDIQRHPHLDRIMDCYLQWDERNNHLVNLHKKSGSAWSPYEGWKNPFPGVELMKAQFEVASLIVKFRQLASETPRLP